MGAAGPGVTQANGIGSTAQLIRYLRDMPTARRTDADEDLLIGLEGLAAQRLLRPLFDESLPVPDIATTQCVIWNFAGLKLPTVTEEYQAHLHQQTTPGQRAAQALYGLGAEVAQSIFSAAPISPTCWSSRSAQRGPTLRAGRSARTRSSARAVRPGRGSAVSASSRSKTSPCWRTSSSISDCAWDSSDLTSPKQPCSGVTATWTATRSCWPTTSTTPAPCSWSTTATTRSMTATER